MNKYYLNIYYRSIAATQEAGAVSEDKSPGHVYVGLKGDDSEEEFFGLYMPDGLIPVGPGKVKTKDEKQMHLFVKDFSKKMNKDTTFTKQIELTQEQYNKAINYAKQKVSEDNYYVMGFKDCIDFTQSIYHAAGLPLYFTHVYSAKELSKIPGLASYKMAHIIGNEYGSRDNTNLDLLNVSGRSREEVASRLNIPVERVTQVVDIDLNARLSLLPTFQVTLNDSDLLPKELVTTINLLDNTSTVQKLDERDDTSYKFEIIHINKKILGYGEQSSSNKIECSSFIVRLKKDNEIISITQSPKQLSNNAEKMVLSDAEKSIMLDRLKKAQDSNGNDESNNSIHRKVLNLNAEQYNKIVKYIESGIKHNEVQILNKDVIGATSIESTSSDVNNSNTSSNSNQESYYAFSADDSASLVQNLYPATGLPLYFTAAYSKPELVNLESVDAKKALEAYSSRDDIIKKLNSIYGDSKEEIAKMLNLDPEQVSRASKLKGCVPTCRAVEGTKFSVKIDQEMLDSITSIIDVSDNKSIKHEDLVQGLQNVFLSHKIPPELPKDQLSHLDQNTNFSTLKSQISNVLSHSKSIFDKLLGKVDQQAAESNNSGHSIYTQDQVTKLFMEKYEALQKEYSNAHNKTSSGLLIYNNTVTPKAQKIFQEKELALSTWISDELAKIPGTPQYLQTHQSSDKTPAVSSKTHHDKIVTSWNKEIDTARTKDFFNDKIDKSLNNPNKAIADLDKEFDIFLQGASSELHVDLETL